MKAQDVTATLDLALAASGLDQMTVVHRLRLLSDNGSSYVASDLADWLDKQNIEHVRGAPYHPQTQGKIERWHQTLKNRILLEHYYLPGDLERQVRVATRSQQIAFWDPDKFLANANPPPPCFVPGAGGAERSHNPKLNYNAPLSYIMARMDVTVPNCWA